jgi:hypothetical protein
MKDMQIPLNIIWDHLLPGITDEELPESPDYLKLEEKLATLKVLLPEGRKTSAIIPETAKKKFRLSGEFFNIESISLDFDPDCIHMNLETGSQNQTLNIGIGHWMENFLLNEGQRVHFMLTGIWKEDNSLLLQCRQVETPFALQLRLTFNGNQVKLESKINVSFANEDWNEVIGVN